MSAFSRSKPDIEKMLRQKDVRKLEKALRHSEASTRRDAAQALGRIGKAALPACQALQQVTKDGDVVSYV